MRARPALGRPVLAHGRLKSARFGPPARLGLSSPETPGAPRALARALTSSAALAFRPRNLGRLVRAGPAMGRPVLAHGRLKSARLGPPARLGLSSPETPGAPRARAAARR